MSPTEPSKRTQPFSVSPKFSRDSNNEEVDLIDVINNLQNKLAVSGHSIDIPVPQIVAIGGQSAGKSSVLESFVGREFLPRGSGLVTRRPIIIQLTPSTEEYGIFQHLEDRKFHDFNAIREEITRATDEECGPNGFSQKPISLQICSPRVLKLTVVDLPGIVKVPVGDQKQEVVQIVDDMIMKYIKEDNCIILAVTPISNDLTGSHALEYAKKVDPDGKRTVGVLTKLDSKEADTDIARDILENKYHELKKGWVGVINRSKEEMIDGKDMDYILKKERDFFQNSKFYSHMAYRMGTPYLQKLLQKTLIADIKDNLPRMRVQINQKLLNFKRELNAVENIIGEGPNSSKLYMFRLIQKFSDEIKVNIMGYDENVPENTITYGAVINIKLYTEVQRILQQVLTPDDDEIACYILSLNGMRNSISIPSLVVDCVCRKLIGQFKDPLDSAVICIRNIVMDAVKEHSSIFNPYPFLKQEVLYQINSWIEQESESTQKRLKEHIDAETFYINTAHADFDSTTCDPLAPPAGPLKIWADIDTKKGEESDEKKTYKVEEFSDALDSLLIKENELKVVPELHTVPVDKTLLKNDPQMQKQVQYVIALVVKYLEIIQKQISDTAIKYIAYFLVKKVLDLIKFNLVAIVLDESNMASIAEDCDDEIRRKEEIELACETLEEALEAIKSF